MVTQNVYVKGKKTDFFCRMVKKEYPIQESRYVPITDKRNVDLFDRNRNHDVRVMSTHPRANPRDLRSYQNYRHDQM